MTAIFLLLTLLPLLLWAICQTQINTLEKKIEDLAKAAKDKAE